MYTAAAIPQIEALEVSRVIAAPRERVFRAWTEAAELSRWFGPTSDHKTEVPELDLRVGGKYRFEIHNKDVINRVGGVYREIHPPEKLVFTWKWDRPEAPETLVSVTFRDIKGSTEVVVTHSGFTEEQDREAHRHGWLGALEKFSKAV